MRLRLHDPLAEDVAGYARFDSKVSALDGRATERSGVASIDTMAREVGNDITCYASHLSERHQRHCARGSTIQESLTARLITFRHMASCADVEGITSEPKLSTFLEREICVAEETLGRVRRVHQARHELPAKKSAVLGEIRDGLILWLCDNAAMPAVRVDALLIPANTGASAPHVAYIETSRISVGGQPLLRVTVGDSLGHTAASTQSGRPRFVRHQCVLPAKVRQDSRLFEVLLSVMSPLKSGLTEYLLQVNQLVILASCLHGGLQKYRRASLPSAAQEGLVCVVKNYDTLLRDRLCEYLDDADPAIRVESWVKFKAWHRRTAHALAVKSLEAL